MTGCTANHANHAKPHLCRKKAQKAQENSPRSHEPSPSIGHACPWTLKSDPGLADWWTIIASDTIGEFGESARLADG